MDIGEQVLILIIVYVYIRHVRPRTMKRKRDNTSSVSGRDYTFELLAGTDRQCLDLLRMSKDAYMRLCAHFKEKGWLKDSKHVSVEEKIAMFLLVIGHNERYVVVKRRFQHSLHTIHVYFHEVLEAMMEFAKEVIVPTSYNPSPDIPGRNRRLRRIFKGAVGALDGTLISAIVPVNKQNLYRGRGKGECCQNVLAICDFNMIFTFVLAGWEGVAHDSRILSEIVVDPNAGFPIPPPDKYYLCDAAYTHTRGFMAPYRNVRYWLGDFRRIRAETKEEKFNHAHAKLRNVIERSFGVLKARFPILKRMAPFSLNVQRDITIACFAVHNFIRKENIADDFFSKFEEPDMYASNENEQDGNEEETGDEGPELYGSTAEMQFMANLREEIAVELMPL